jgi:hypothetical protein
MPEMRARIPDNEVKENTKRMREWREKKKKNDPKWWEERKAKRREEYKKKKAENPDFFNNKMKQWRIQKLKKDPQWNARRQREFRKKYPEKYNMIMAKSYMRKLTPEQRKEIIKRLEEENGQKRSGN